METQYFKWYSPALGRDMECKIYGHAGHPALFVPCQDGHFYDFENFRMADTLAPWIESGQMMVISIDTIDLETWSDKGGDAYWRIRRYEDWITYITQEVVPFICEKAGREGVLVFGCSLGATHAANLYLRFPNLFDRVMALSGIYTSEYGFDGYMDEVVYQNSPVHYMANMAPGHPFIAQYNQQKGVICVGQGAWEIPDTTRRLQQIFQEKDIHLWVDFWGHDCFHDWDWWYKQTTYFIPYLLG